MWFQMCQGNLHSIIRAKGHGQLAGMLDTGHLITELSFLNSVVGVGSVTPLCTCCLPNLSIPCAQVFPELKNMCRTFFWNYRVFLWWNQLGKGQARNWVPLPTQTKPPFWNSSLISNMIFQVYTDRSLERSLKHCTTQYLLLKWKMILSEIFRGMNSKHMGYRNHLGPLCFWVAAAVCWMFAVDHAVLSVLQASSFNPWLTFDVNRRKMWFRGVKKPAQGHKAIELSGSSS